MVLIDNFNKGEIRYCDCLDFEFGLSSLKDKSIDLCLTDPPWGKDMKENKRKYINQRILDNTDKIFFEDQITETFNKTYFKELNRICKRLILVLGDSLLLWFIKNIDVQPTGILPIFWKNSPFACSYAKRKRHSFYLLYGKFDTKFEHSILAKTYKSTNVEPFTYYWGFTNPERHFNHPSPKGLEIPLRILKELKPSSLLDPFVGSGTYIRCAEILGIPWIGYEINDQEYREDVNYRFSEQLITKWL